MQYGVRPCEFWRLSLKEFYLIQEANIELWKIEQRDKWELARWQCYILLQPHTKKGTIKSPIDIIKFEWETEKIDINKINKEIFDIFPKKLN